jgi:hypothetical protein
MVSAFDLFDSTAVVPVVLLPLQVSILFPKAGTIGANGRLAEWTGEEIGIPSEAPFRIETGGGGKETVSHEATRERRNRRVHVASRTKITITCSTRRCRTSEGIGWPRGSRTQECTGAGRGWRKHNCRCRCCLRASRPVAVTLPRIGRGRLAILGRAFITRLFSSRNLDRESRSLVDTVGPAGRCNAWHG